MQCQQKEQAQHEPPLQLTNSTRIVVLGTQCEPTLDVCFKSEEEKEEKVEPRKGNEAGVTPFHLTSCLGERARERKRERGEKAAAPGALHPVHRPSRCSPHLPAFVLFDAVLRHGSTLLKSPPN